MCPLGNFNVSVSFEKNLYLVHVYVCTWCWKWIGWGSEGVEIWISQLFLLDSVMTMHVRTNFILKKVCRVIQSHHSPDVSISLRTMSILTLTHWHLLAICVIIQAQIFDLIEYITIYDDKRLFCCFQTSWKKIYRRKFYF